MIQMGRLNERVKATDQQHNFFRGKAGEQPVAKVRQDFGDINRDRRKFKTRKPKKKERKGDKG